MADTILGLVETFRGVLGSLPDRLGIARLEAFRWLGSAQDAPASIDGDLDTGRFDIEENSFSRFSGDRGPLLPPPPTIIHASPQDTGPKTLSSLHRTRTLTQYSHRTGSALPISYAESYNLAADCNMVGHDVRRKDGVDDHSIPLKTPSRRSRRSRIDVERGHVYDDRIHYYPGLPASSYRPYSVVDGGNPKYHQALTTSYYGPDPHADGGMAPFSHKRASAPGTSSSNSKRHDSGYGFDLYELGARSSASIHDHQATIHHEIDSNPVPGFQPIGNENLHDLWQRESYDTVREEPHVVNSQASNPLVDTPPAFGLPPEIPPPLSSFVEHRPIQNAPLSVPCPATPVSINLERNPWASSSSTEIFQTSGLSTETLHPPTPSAVASDIPGNFSRAPYPSTRDARPPPPSTRDTQAPRHTANHQTPHPPPVDFQIPRLSTRNTRERPSPVVTQAQRPSTRDSRAQRRPTVSFQAPYPSTADHPATRTPARDPRPSGHSMEYPRAPRSTADPRAPGPSTGHPQVSHPPAAPFRPSTPAYHAPQPAPPTVPVPRPTVIAAAPNRTRLENPPRAGPARLAQEPRRSTTADRQTRQPLPTRVDHQAWDPAAVIDPAAPRAHPAPPPPSPPPPPPSHPSTTRHHRHRERRHRHQSPARPARQPEEREHSGLVAMARWIFGPRRKGDKRKREGHKRYR